MITHLEATLQEQASQKQSDKQKSKTSLETMPPKSHTLMDLLITMSIYLPRSSYQKLFSVTALLLPKSSDPQLQKKAYKLLPRLAGSETGKEVLKERNADLQQLILNNAASASTPARRDRLVGIGIVIQYMPESSLHFIPSILSEVVISAKEVNEKARATAFDLLVLMGQKMAQGGVIDQCKIPHMAMDASTTQASLEEYFTMVSAGLAGNTPHMISASVTALTRILYEFRSDLDEAVLQDLVSTMDLFLTSKNREIVRSVLGFAKVAIISLPDSIMIPRLATMIPSLLSWSHEHKNQFRSKVKHVMERAIRRFGYEAVARHCPEDDKKLISNIHKTRERRKRKKVESTQDGEDVDVDADENKARTKGRFESEFDEAVYGSASSDDSEGIGSDNDDGNRRGAKSKNRTKSKSYIIEAGSDPLDLLDKKAFSSISSTKPVRFKESIQRKTKAKTDLDGKLVFDDNDDDVMSVDEVDDRNVDLEKGINAYVEAIRGQHAAQRGRGGKIKFSNRREKDDELDDEEDDGDDGMDIDRPGQRNTNRGLGSRSEVNTKKVRRGGGGGSGLKPGIRVSRNVGSNRRGRGGFGGNGNGSSSSRSGMNSRSGSGASAGIKGGRFKVAKYRARSGGDGDGDGKIGKGKKQKRVVI